MTHNLLSLFCLVDGDTTPFSVEVDRTKTVDHLKDHIKAKKAPEFNDIAADKLTLWRVTIPVVPPNRRKPIVLTEVKSAAELDPTDDLCDVFEEKPPKKTIHVIVQRPPLAPKRGREPEPETSQKLPKILAGTIFADKSPYIEALEKGATNYRYVFLRPRRFGKSAFLNMLCAYYDVHNAGIFDDLFGPLYIGKNPTASKNKHLILKFDLSSISVSSSMDKLEISFKDYINGVLMQFLQKYRSELGFPEKGSIINNSNASQSLRQILGQSLFVGVDEYDAPANNSAFAGGNTGLGKGILDNVQHIESFFKENLFSILKEGCSAASMNDYGVIISKYFLTGVTPAFRAGISPLAATAIVSNNRSLHGICGFTESEVKAIVKHYLRMNDQEAEPLVHSVRRLYNGYYFAMSGYDESNSSPPLVYNPHLVFHYLSNFQSEGFVAKPEESTAVHSTTILKSIADVGEFSVNDLVGLIVSKSVQSKIKTEFGYSELLSVGKDREITWSLLFYLGVLTLSSDGSLRVPNDIIKSEVLDRIAAFLRTQDKISALMVPAIRNLKAGRAVEFCELLETFFSSRAVRSLQTANEAVLQGIVELLLDEPSNRIPELRLVVDGSKEPGKGRFGFVGIFIPRQATAIGSEQTCVVMELKNATLEGLWKGATSRKSDYKDLESLRETLCSEDESSLLSRKYAHWSQGDGGWTTVTLEFIMEASVKQLQRYMQTIALGKVRSYDTSGVLDSRVNIDHGLDDLQGYVLMAIGGARVLVRPVERIETECEYVRALQL
ncbi:hypothetical protein CPC16_004587 [Podila verticillata]|nr:hypothetical protein CPC16_004587 [Podila verticillata]